MRCKSYVWGGSKEVRFISSSPSHPPKVSSRWKKRWHQFLGWLLSAGFGRHQKLLGACKNGMLNCLRYFASKKVSFNALSINRTSCYLFHATNSYISSSITVSFSDVSQIFKVQAGCRPPACEQHQKNASGSNLLNKWIVIWNVDLYRTSFRRRRDQDVYGASERYQHDIAWLLPDASIVTTWVSVILW